MNCPYTIILKLILICHCVQVISKDSNHLLVMWRAALIFRGYSKIFIVAAFLILNFTWRHLVVILYYMLHAQLFLHLQHLSQWTESSLNYKKIPPSPRAGTSQKTRNPLTMAGMETRMWLSHYSTRLHPTHFTFLFIFTHCYSYSCDLLQI